MDKISKISKADLAVLLQAEQAVDILRQREDQKLFYHLFPDATHSWRGQIFHGREMYPRHMELIGTTLTHRECAIMAANRAGKTTLGAFMMAVWLTGLYPKWWEGKVFKNPVAAWAVGRTNETTRDIIQKTLLGDVTGVTRAGKAGRRQIMKGFDGTGVIPGHLIGGSTWRRGIGDSADTVLIQHVPTGSYSILGLKSYQQGRDAFAGTAQHVIWADEEPPIALATEMLTRTATTKGRVIFTFTPLDGMSETAMRFLTVEGDQGA